MYISFASAVFSYLTFYIYTLLDMPLLCKIEGLVCSRDVIRPSS